MCLMNESLIFAALEGYKVVQSGHTFFHCEDIWLPWLYFVPYNGLALKTTKPVIWVVLALKQFLMDALCKLHHDSD